MKRFVVSWGVVCALALGGLACGEVPEPVDTGGRPEAPARSEAAMLPVFVPHPEPIRYAYRPVLYVNNFTQTAPLPSESTLRAPGGVVDQIRSRIYDHMAHLNRESNGLLQPSFDGNVTINYSRNLDSTKFGRKGPGNQDLYVLGGEVDSMFAGEFNSTLPAMAFLLWNGGPGMGTNLPQITYNNAFIVMSAGQTYPSTSYENFYDMTHETLHMFDFRLEKGTLNYQASKTAIVHADNIINGNCIAPSGTAPTGAYTSSGALDWAGDVLGRNILSYNESCTTTVPTRYINWCEFSGGGAAFGTFNSDLCSEGALLNPLVDHSWVRNASMIDANWLYTEWDPAQGANTYVFKVEALNSSNAVVATVQKTETGGTDRGAYRYRYFHRNDICPVIKAAGAPGGTYRLRFRVSPSMPNSAHNALYAHKKDVSGTITCGYVVDTATTSTLGGHGGSGGSASTMSCPAGTVAVGLVGRSGPYVDALGLLCATLNLDGSLGAAFSSGYYGGSGGTSFVDQCPSGQMLVGLAGSSWSWTDRIAGDCANVKTWISSGGINTYLGSHGGSGGAAYTEICPQGYGITSLYLRAVAYVDYIQGRCTRTLFQ